MLGIKYSAAGVATALALTACSEGAPSSPEAPAHVLSAQEIVDKEYSKRDSVIDIGKIAISLPLSDNRLNRCFGQTLEPITINPLEVFNKTYENSGYDSRFTQEQVQEQREQYTKAYEMLEEAQEKSSTPGLLVFEMGDGAPKAMPRTLANSEINNNIVRLQVGDTYGSGFIIKDASNEPLVITAAHVAGMEKLNNIVVSDTQGNSSRAKSGCFVYETDKTFATPGNPDMGSQDVDIAILRVGESLGASGLQFAKKGVKRGEWVRFTNFGNTNSTQVVRDFQGVIVRGPDFSGRISAITDLCSRKTPKEAEVNLATCGFLGGGSGGVVTNGEGEVVGISTAGMNYSNYYSDAKDLKDSFNLSFPGAHYGFETGFTPDDTTVIPFERIVQVLTGLLPKS